jgi:hypothetical protein
MEIDLVKLKIVSNKIKCSKRESAKLASKQVSSGCGGRIQITMDHELCLLNEIIADVASRKG